MNTRSQTTERHHNHVILIAMLATTLFLAIPGLIWLQATGGFGSSAGGHIELPGQWAYTLTKLTGLYACLAASLQTLYGLLGRRLLHKRWWRVGVHQAIGTATLCLAAAHLLLFMIAVTARTSEVPWHLLLPDFATGYYRSSLSLGWLALMLIVVVFSAGVTRRYWPRRWIWLHRLAPLVIVLGVSHALLVGSEAKTVLLTLFYLANLLLVLGATVWALRNKSS